MAEVEAPSQQKAALIVAALRSLRAAHAIDERHDNLDAASWVTWYDQTLPHVGDIKILAGAMEVEMAKRRGEQVAAEGERRGRPEKATQRVALSEATKKQQQRDRALAGEPAAVQSYVQREAAAGRVPSVRGAVRAAKAARAVKTPPRSKGKEASAPEVVRFAERIRLEVRQRIEQVSDKPLTLDELAQRWKVHPDIARRYLREAALYGEVVKDGDHFTVTLPLGLEAYKRKLHAVIMERRKEARDGYHGWRPDNVHTVRLSTLLDWLEDELAGGPQKQGATA